MRRFMQITSIATVSLLSLALAGCSGNTPQADESASAAPTAATVPTPAETSEAAPEASAPASATPEPAASATPTPDAKPSVAAAADPAKDAPAPAATKVAVAAAVTPPAAFARCAVCHNAAKGAEAKIGPNLWGVYGTKAGELKGYAFSDALKASGLTWNDATLDQWIEGPMKMVPGTMMSFPGIKDPAKRAEIVAFLKSAR